MYLAAKVLKIPHAAKYIRIIYVLFRQVGLMPWSSLNIRKTYCNNTQWSAWCLATTMGAMDGSLGLRQN